MFWAKTVGNYTITVEINERYLFGFDIREWPENVALAGPIDFEKKGL